jgi:ElaA protein
MHGIIPDYSTRVPTMTLSSSEFDWRWKPFADLESIEVYDMLGARSAVFVVEQECVYADIDGQDVDAWHLLVYEDEALAGYLRVLLPNHPDESETDIRIGRVLTAAGFRGIGLGQAMLERTLTLIHGQWPGQAVRLHAQAHLQRFYGAFGFDPISDIHLEDDIPHVWMRRP